MKFLKGFLGFLIFLIVFGLLAYYWLLPFNSLDFIPNGGNSNFSINSSVPMDMLFYPNLRYASPDISYNIDMSLCTLQKQDDMVRAFDTIQNLTILKFSQTESNPDIQITCDSKVVVDANYFVAGEGGPSNIIKSGDLNVIEKGEILLLRDSNCQTPNVAIHELLHALGFNHSINQNNIMYPVTTCRQTIGQDIPSLINTLYSVPSYSDLSFENVSATVHGRYLDTNFTIVNHGLIKSGDSEMIISADGNEISRETIQPLDVGTGIIFISQNTLLKNTNIAELEYTLQSDFSEISTANNQLVLKIKN